MAHFRGPRARYGRPFGASGAVRAGLNLQNENPPGISPGGPTSLAPSLPPVHPRSEAWSRTRFYIGGNHEYSMTTVRKQRVRNGTIAHARALGEALRAGKPNFHTRIGATTEGAH